MTTYANSTLAEDYKRILSRLRNAKEKAQRVGFLFAAFGLTVEDINKIVA